MWKGKLKLNFEVLLSGGVCGKTYWLLCYCFDCLCQDAYVLCFIKYAVVVYEKVKSH